MYWFSLCFGTSLVDEIDSVEIGVTIRELPDKTLTRCSMRTKGNISANEICKALGGGGHEHAAACYLPNVDVYQAREKIEEVCKKFLFMSIKNNMVLVGKIGLIIYKANIPIV